MAEGFISFEEWKYGNYLYFYWTKGQEHHGKVQQGHKQIYYMLTQLQLFEKHLHKRANTEQEPEKPEWWQKQVAAQQPEPDLQQLKGSDGDSSC